uniref:AlNc14C189G8411 protein n=1 Tax=Albugo laibachii Nc14 TaxID=890382 RepID=F0WPR9_9STRA|nr:AlNc14C189G8411 [Albugo laibachii Nc14]CCA24344.1 AlNc14C235G9362 [Albugo laibachii Nc14]|eukprot:CCA24344.1 AlNc14C235G9362 [Albugo laibachii Nc14]
MRLQYTIGIPTGHVKLNHSHVCGEVLSIHCGMEDIFDRNQAESHTRAQQFSIYMYKSTRQRGVRHHPLRVFSLSRVAVCILSIQCILVFSR